MPGRPCQICASAANIKIAAEMIAAGASDQAVADKIGGINRMTAHRHRINHVQKPAQIIAEAAGKGLAVRQEREKLVQAAETDAVAAFIGLAGIVDDLKQVRDRLERTATVAEDGAQLGAVAALTAQQTRLADTRAKLGSVGGYAPAKAQEANLPIFNLTIQFSGGQTEHITAVGGPAIDMEPLPDDGLPDDPDDIEDEEV